MNKHQIYTIEPGATIGILGGGQLGRMLALAGRSMGYRFVTLDPTPDCPCGQVADFQILASYDDVTAAEQLMNQCDVITYEFENVDSKMTEILSKEANVPQGADLLYITQHRVREKTALQNIGVPIVPYAIVKNADDLKQKTLQIGFPCILKTVMGGYDGKGQMILYSQDQVQLAWDKLYNDQSEFILEGFISLDKEFSVIVARNLKGEVKAFPPAENKHIENILHLSIVPARIPENLQTRAIQIATQIAESLEVIGLLAVEFFVDKTGNLYVNELAPRPHNSGHYTMEACHTSQFEQHIRAICNLPLGSTQLLTPVVMVNILGEHIQPLMNWLHSADQQLQEKNISAKIHLYGKHEAKSKRKMGHINLLTTNVENALIWIQQCGIWAQEYSRAEEIR